MKTIFLSRHGETDDNRNMRYQGRKDNSLNAMGRKQAERLAELMKDIPLAAVYSSPLLRAMQSAEPVAKSKGLEIIPVEALQEISFGKWEGMTYEEIEERWPDNIHAMFSHPGEMRVIGGEGFQDLQRRAWPAFQQIVAEQKEDTSILVMCHGGTFRALLCAMLDIPLNNVWRLSASNVSLTCILKVDNRYMDDEYILKYLNYTGRIL